MKKGFVKFYRDYGSHQWSNDPNTMAVLIRCLLNANIENGYFCGQPIKAGSFATSLSSLSKQCGVSIQSVRTALSRLSADQIIDVETIKSQHTTNTDNNTKSTYNQHTSNTLPTKGFTIITLCDSDVYTDKSTDSQQATNTLPTSNQHAPNTDDNTLVTTIKEKEYYKDIEKERNQDNISNQQCLDLDIENKDITDTIIIPASASDANEKKQKKKKYTKDEQHFHGELRDIFLDEWRNAHNDDYAWSAVAMKKTIEIKDLIVYKMKKDGETNITNENIKDNFRIFLRMIFVGKAGDFFRSADPQIIASKFNTIYSQLKNGTSRQQPNNGSDPNCRITRDWLEEKLRQASGIG